MRKGEALAANQTSIWFFLHFRAHPSPVPRGNKMGMKLEITCSMCIPMRGQPIELYIEGPKDLDPKSLKKRIEKEGWIVQFNGDHMDTYCTKKCAE
jgi:hypothetical protein